ncbi:hypothetical protein [Raoultella ornithinolytica]|uniref:hypothetical protein n=1 Tax=Raoultella ornithinolytica TaxID=54291 RepID=UPI0022A84AC4|nr:hypothetical protein [Raoultella ornithinolytica]MCZ0881469.1 hypothetical protein [Raoultella ornithinolytica]
MKTVIAVILYNKQINDSETLKQLSIIKCDDCSLIIFNNGPKKIKRENTLYYELMNAYSNIEIKEYIQNKPLSQIYNEVLKCWEGDRFIFFDDDSHLDELFFKKIDAFYSKEIDLQIPVIYEITNKQLYYPIVDGVTYKASQSSDGTVIPSNNVLSIGSGLVIYKCLVNKFYELNLDLFDERFALYGVDFSFFRRINLVRKKAGVNIQVVSFIKHSLSRTNTIYNVTRHRERLYDNSLTIKHYSRNKLISILKLTKLIASEFFHFRFMNVYLVFVSYLTGKHPRC